MNKTILSNDQHNFRYSAAVQEINESLKCVEDVNLVIRSKIKGVKKLVKTWRRNICNKRVVFSSFSDKKQMKNSK